MLCNRQSHSSLPSDRNDSYTVMPLMTAFLWCLGSVCSCLGFSSNRSFCFMEINPPLLIWIQKGIGGYSVWKNYRKFWKVYPASGLWIHIYRSIFLMGLRNTVKRWGFSLLAQDSPIVTQNSLSWFFVPGNLDGDSVPHSHGTHKISDFGYLAPHECVRSRTPTAYRELLCNYKSAGGTHYGTTKKSRKHQTHKQCNGSFQ